MNFKITNLLRTGLAAACALTVFTSCNKDVEDAVPVTVAAPSGQSAADVINSDASFSLLKFAAARAGVNVTALLGDRTGVFTFFAPPDAAFAASGFPDTTAIKGLPAAAWASILQYHIVGGQKIMANMISETFPNIQLPTQLVLQAPSAAIPVGLRMSSFASRRGTSAWINNIPLTQTDILVANGVVHKTFALLSPPSTTLKGLIASNPTKYSILSAAIARADSGLTVSAGLGRLDSAINFPAANLTMFAPNNDAFRALFPPGTPDAAIIGALNTYALFPAQTVRGLIAYHLLGSRAFSVNFAAGPAPVNTQLVIPGTTTVIPVLVSYGGPAGAFTARGIAPGAALATVVTRDVHAVNGVLHEVNQVLRPQ